MADSEFENFVKRMQSMRQLSRVEIINNYWLHSESIAQSKKIAFIIRGNLQWDTNNDLWVENEDDLQLKSNYFKGEGKHILENQTRRYLQNQLNLYEIWGTLPIDIDPNNVESSMPILRERILYIDKITNALSFLFGASLDWLPANYTKVKHVKISPPPPKEEYESWICIPFRKSQEEYTSIIITDENIDMHLFPFLKTLSSLSKESSELGKILHTAISWHSIGNRHNLGLYRFVAYWSSVELLSNWYYRKISEKLSRSKKREKQQQLIMQIINNNDFSEKTCFNKIIECYHIINPTAREKINKFFEIMDDANDLSKIIFSKDNTKKNLIMIRNEIAHGSISENDFEIKEELKKRVYDASSASNKIIYQTIMCAKKIIQNIST